MCFDDLFFSLIWVLCPFQEYFTYRADRSSKVGENWSTQGKPPGHPKAEHGFPTCDPSETRTTAVRNDEILVSVYIINILYAYMCAVLGPRG